jgi:hypothetical protein
MFGHGQSYSCYAGSAGIGFVFNPTLKGAYKIAVGFWLNKIYVDAFLAL